MYRRFVRSVYGLMGALMLLTAAPASAQEDQGPICVNTYALCTSAPCIPDPSAPEDQAICNCTVQEGPNFGSTTCEERDPVTLAGTTGLLSTYSFQEAAVRDVMTCDGDPAGPWTDCLDAVCIVDPRDPGQAICTCPYAPPGPYVTYGGGCDTNTCTTGYWSAATLDAFEVGSAALLAYAERHGLDTSDGQPYAFCPAE